MTNLASGHAKPRDIDQLIAMIQTEFPSAGVRITGRARTTRRQAERMAERIRASRQEFLAAYRRTQHIIDMDQWYLSHRSATFQQTAVEFEAIIVRARARGAVVSNHLSNIARDISWPLGSAPQVDRVEARIRALGATVIREPNAAGGRHWHVDW